MLEEMERLMQILRKKRKKRGAIDFNFSESKVVLDENGVPLEIRPQEPNTCLLYTSEIPWSRNQEKMRMLRKAAIC